MTNLLKSALQELEKAQASFSGKPIAAAVTKSLTALEMGAVAREAIVDTLEEALTKANPKEEGA